MAGLESHIRFGQEGPALPPGSPPPFYGPLRRPALRAAAWFCILAWPSILAARPAAHRFESLRASRDSLALDFSVEGLFDRDALRDLKKGATAAVEYQVQVWEKREGWVDGVVAECWVRMKVGYDPWERRYVVERPGGTATFPEGEAAGRCCSRLDSLCVAPVSHLKPGRAYRVVVRVVFQPMAMESVAEVRRWLSGEAEDLNAKSLKRVKSPWKSAGDWLLGFVVNVSGFGDRVVTAVSPELAFENGAVRVLGGG